MSPTRAHLTAKAILISHPEIEGQLLAVEIDIDCPDCGVAHLRLAGHHLKAVRDICLEFIDLYPELTGKEAGLQVLKRLQWTGTAPENPEDN